MSLVHSLGFRLLVPLFLTVGAVLAVHALLSLDATRTHFMLLVQEEVKRSSSLVQKATHDGMLQNRLDEVQTTIERLAEAPDVAALRIFDKRGTIVMSATHAEIGTCIDIAAEPCLSCHRSEAPMSTARLEQLQMPRQDGNEVLRHLVVIPNEATCGGRGCHDPVAEAPVLGVLDIEMSMARVEATVAAAQRQFVLATVVLLVVIGLVATAFVRRLVHTPVALLRAGTLRIAAGDLGTRIPVHGRHEIAELGAAFNRMAEDLGAARAELQQWSRSLEMKVVAKTAELQRAHRQVLHMEKMASLGKLSATVAHELNNPLTGVLTYARLVDRELCDQPLADDVRAELQRYLSLIQKECVRCGDIVKNLLLFARHHGAAMAPCDVNEIVDRALMLVRHHFAISNVQVRHQPLVGDPPMVAAARQIQQGLLALLMNAIEAMRGPGLDGGELLVRVTGDADEVCIDVGDTGVGIPPDILPQIFEPFFSTKNEESGVGLGLAVVFGIVQRHGGRIDLESTPGQGTTFHLHLPRQPRGQAERG
ncbi:MAG: HAMP domain-containing protein [Planctomycetes bacterium]|nr:HAMP domain-containing protein [Planctomycetota bacterium]